MRRLDSLLQPRQLDAQSNFLRFGWNQPERVGTFEFELGFARVRVFISHVVFATIGCITTVDPLTS